MADKLRKASPFGIDYPSNIVFVTRLSGRELARFDNAFDCAPGRNPLYAEHAQWIPQYTVEQVMRDHLAGIESVQLRLRCQLSSIAQRGDSVIASIASDADNALLEVEAQYVVGCDGARSVVREVIGARLEGSYGLSRNYNFVFRAPGLEQAHAHGKAIMYWQVSEDQLSIIGPMDSGDRWYFLQTGMAQDARISKDNAADYIRKATGIDLPYEILSCDEWVASKLLATHYRDRRVFIAGDAAHLHPPFGGFGMNMGIGDAVDLGWKLAAVLQGWGGPALLDSYERERRPVHMRVMEEATANHAQLGRALSQAGMEEESAAGEALRASVGQRIRSAKLSEFHTLGTILGDCYGDSPVIGTPFGEPPPRDFLNYVPCAQPGHRAPHAWLHDGSSLFDHFGAGFTLLLSGDADDGAEAACAAAELRGIPLTLFCCANAGVRALYQQPLTLIRPDQHIAWIGARWPDQAVDDVLSKVAGFERIAMSDRACSLDPAS